MIDFYAEAAGLDRFSSNLKRFTWTKMAVGFADATAPLLRDRLKAAAPVGQDLRAGRLRDSIRATRDTTAGHVTLTFTAPTPYTGFVLHGTHGPYSIDPKAARVLSWAGGSGRVFAHHVSHPGIRANPFPHDVLNRSREEITAMFRAAIAASLR